MHVLYDIKKINLNFDWMLQVSLNLLPFRECSVVSSTIRVRIFASQVNVSGLKGDWHDDVVDTCFRLIASDEWLFEHFVFLLPHCADAWWCTYRRCENIRSTGNLNIRCANISYIFLFVHILNKLDFFCDLEKPIKQNAINASAK